MKNKLFFSILLILLLPIRQSAQQYTGTSGLINVPSAEIDTMLVIKAGVHFVPKEILPDELSFENKKYNSGNYYVSITPFRWIELSYCRTLTKQYRGPSDDDNPRTSLFYGTKRVSSVRIRPLAEKNWWPSILIGESNVIKGLFSGSFSISTNFYFSISKHFYCQGWKLGSHVSYRYYKEESHKKWNGIVGGITLQPSFYNSLRAICEYDGNTFNMGADCLLFKHFQLQASLIDLRHFAGGACLYITL